MDNEEVVALLKALITKICSDKIVVIIPAFASPNDAEKIVASVLASLNTHMAAGAKEEKA